jgi:DNA-binding NarL/FixJ family response regulator
MEGLRTLLHGTGAWRVVAAERLPGDLLDVIRELSPAVAVFDRAFGLEPLLDSITALRDSRAPTAPVVWGISISEADAVRLLEAGALGAVRKTCNLSALVECMGAAASGGTWVEDGLMAAAGSPACTTPLRLTRRERQILELVERSLRNREIAAALGIRIGTVKIHLRHISEKAGVRGRYGLALSCLRDRQPAVDVM